MSRLLVCGGRDDQLGAIGRALLIGFGQVYSPVTLIHGAARGVDSQAADMARRLGWEVEPHPADWLGQGRAAGPIRNARMLRARPDVVVAVKERFDWSFTRGGTENMIDIARRARVPAYVLQRVML